MDVWGGVRWSGNRGRVVIIKDEGVFGWENWRVEGVVA